MNLFTTFKYVLFADIIGFLIFLFMYCLVRIMKFFLDRDYMFLSRFFAVVSISSFTAFYCFLIGVFLDYMSRFLP